MKQDLRISYRMIRPGETAEARITLSMLTDTAGFATYTAKYLGLFFRAFLCLSTRLEGEGERETFWGLII